MALNGPRESEKLDKTLEQTPGIHIFLGPIAPPAALGLAGFAGSTWITSSYIANWWGSPESPTIFFPFVGLFGGLAQFIAGLYGASGDGLSGGVTMGMKAVSYFWIFAALCAWWRVTVYLVEEAYRPDHTITKFFPVGRTPIERRAPLVIPGLGEPGVKRGVPKPLLV
ncbi:hypothetical protein PtrSN002B_007351 [Pyrenophora tritici-repentis]|nr:hypothetical protein PtrSN002B_007351 [Pyrenophora tritici-repentis]KAI1567122.1 hypothetical protein PtrEW4_007261 [Pyrenophora tritici-repentis]KAI1583477.1 hypothetical protein PtrEW7m1_003319 [Pyrenophora tritici-repentis]